MDRDALLYLALRGAALVVPYLPVRLTYALASAVATIAFYLCHHPRRAIASNLSRVIGAPAGSKQVQRLARRAFRNDALNWVDTLRITVLSEDEIIESVNVTGWERLEGALRGGKGLIIVIMHLGNFDLVGQTVVAHGKPLTIPVERMHPERLFDFVVQRRTSKGMHLVPVERGPRELLRALRRGEAVAVAGDRNLAGRALEVDFFGARTTLPRGPVSLARHTGAPLVVGVGIRRGVGRYDGFVTPPLPVQRTDDGERDDQENERRLVAAMESFIARYPDQWLVFTPVWPADRERTGTIGHQVGAAV